MGIESTGMERNSSGLRKMERDRDGGKNSKRALNVRRK